jgi:hypothetical protein
MIGLQASYTNWSGPVKHGKVFAVVGLLGVLLTTSPPAAGQAVNCAHENAFVWKTSSGNAHGTRTVHKARYHCP